MRSPTEPAPLDARDVQILVALAIGKSRKEIAIKLYMSPPNVAYRIRKMCALFEVHTSTSLLVAAIFSGAFPYGEWVEAAAAAATAPRSADDASTVHRLRDVLPAQPQR